MKSKEDYVLKRMNNRRYQTLAFPDPSYFPP